MGVQIISKKEANVKGAFFTNIPDLVIYETVIERELIDSDIFAMSIPTGNTFFETCYEVECNGKFIANEKSISNAIRAAEKVSKLPIKTLVFKTP